MHVVQLANLVHPTSGGVRTVLARLADGYAQAGHTVTLVSPARHAASTPRVGGSWRTLPGVPLPGGAGYRMLLRRRPLQRLLEALAPDALELSDRWTLAWVGAWAQARGVPVTLLAHERLDRTAATWLPGGRGAQRVRRILDDRQHVDAVVAPSRYVAACVPDAPTTVVPWGVDADTFAPVDAPPLGRPGRDRPVRLAVVSRLSPEKRPWLAVATAAELRARGVPVELRIAGDGPLRDRLASHGLPVTLLGHLDTPDVVRMLATSDVALAPCGIEAFGLSVLESMACGTPVVCTREGGAHEQVDGDGDPPPGAVATAAPGPLADAVQTLLRTPGVRAAARAHAEQRPWSTPVSALLRLHAGHGPADPPPPAAGTASHASARDRTGSDAPW